MYEQALATVNESTKSEIFKYNHRQACTAGVARTCLRLGDISRGMRLLNDFNDSILLQDCSSILESLKQYQEAALLMEKIGKWDRAAQLWIKGII
jgi:WD repeat-containing protein 19